MTHQGLFGALVRLQLKLGWRQTMSSVAMKVGSLIMTLVLLASLVPMVYLMASMRGSPPLTRGVLLTVLFAFLTLMWPIMVTLMTGSNDMLDAGRFALFPVRVGRLLPGLLGAAAMGLGGLMMLLLGIGYVAAWSSSPGTLIAAVAGWLLGFATCLASSRALAALLADVLRRRKARDLTMIVFVLAIIGLSVGIQVLSNIIGQRLDSGGVTVGFGNVVAAVEPLARGVAWTPFGWAWALPWAVADGAVGRLLLWAVLAVAWLALMAWVWARQFGKRLVSPLDATGGAEKITKANPLDRFLPATPAGAIAKRDLRYFRRDPRRLVGVIATLLMPS